MNSTKSDEIMTSKHKTWRGKCMPKSTLTTDEIMQFPSPLHAIELQGNLHDYKPNIRIRLKNFDVNCEMTL